MSISNKGCYWKNKKETTVYWSNSIYEIKKDIIFKNPNEYYAHRVQNGYPKNLSYINIINNPNNIDPITKTFIPPKPTPTRRKRPCGCGGRKK